MVRTPSFTLVVMPDEIRPWLALFQGEGTKSQAVAAGKIGGLGCIDAAFEAPITKSCTSRRRPTAFVLHRSTPCKRTSALPSLRTAAKCLGQVRVGATAQGRIAPRGTPASTRYPQESTHCGRQQSTYRGPFRIARETRGAVSPPRLRRFDVRQQQIEGRGSQMLRGFLLVWCGRAGAHGVSPQTRCPCAGPSSRPDAAVDARAR